MDKETINRHLSLCNGYDIKGIAKHIRAFELAIGKRPANFVYENGINLRREYLLLKSLERSIGRDPINCRLPLIALYCRLWQIVEWLCADKRWNNELWQPLFSKECFDTVVFEEDGSRNNMKYFLNYIKYLIARTDRELRKNDDINKFGEVVMSKSNIDVISHSSTRRCLYKWKQNYLDTLKFFDCEENPLVDPCLSSGPFNEELTEVIDVERKNLFLDLASLAYQSSLSHYLKNVVIHDMKRVDKETNTVTVFAFKCDTTKLQEMLVSLYDKETL